MDWISMIEKNNCAASSNKTNTNVAILHAIASK